MMTNLFDKKDVFSWATCEEARTYIDKKGYFGDSLEELKEQIKEQNLKKLLWIDDSNVICFHPEKQTVTEPNTAFFLPMNKIKQTEKKVRSFKNIKEFLKYFPLGTSLQYRKKGIKTINVYAIVIGVIDILNSGDVILGNEQLSLYELFSEFEYLDNQGNWQVFGVEEDGI